MQFQVKNANDCGTREYNPFAVYPNLCSPTCIHNYKNSNTGNNTHPGCCHQNTYDNTEPYPKHKNSHANPANLYSDWYAFTRGILSEIE